MSEGTVQKILLCADGTDAHLYAIVLCRDGSYAIARDGLLVPSYRWPADDLDDCVQVFAEVSGLKNGKV